MQEFNSQFAHDIAAAWKSEWPDDYRKLERRGRLDSAAIQRAIETADFFVRVISSNVHSEADFWRGFEVAWASATKRPPLFTFPEEPQA